MTKKELKNLRHFEKGYSRMQEFKNQRSDDLDFYKVLWFVFCAMIGMYAGIAITALTGVMWWLPFTFITTYVIAQYNVVLEAIQYPSEMIGEIKLFTVLFIIDIILLIIILV